MGGGFRNVSWSQREVLEIVRLACCVQVVCATGRTDLCMSVMGQHLGRCQLKLCGR